MRIIPDLNSNDLPIGGSGYVSVVGDNPNRKEHVLTKEELDKIGGPFDGIISNRLVGGPLSVSMDWSAIRSAIDQLNSIGRMAAHASHVNQMNNLYGSISSSTFKPKKMNTFEKGKQLKVVCKSIALKNVLMEYAREMGVPTICADQQNRPEFPYIGWSGNMICGFDRHSNANIISPETFVRLCDNWKESQKPVIRLNSEQTIKIDYDEKIVVAGCNHQYKLPFKLIDEIHAKMHEKDPKKEALQFQFRNFCKLDNIHDFQFFKNVADKSGVYITDENPIKSFPWVVVYCNGGEIHFSQYSKTGNDVNPKFVGKRELTKDQFTDCIKNANK